MYLVALFEVIQPLKITSGKGLNMSGWIYEYTKKKVIQLAALDVDWRQ